MTIRVLDVRDNRTASYLKGRDPFLLADPSWKVRVWSQLPPEVVNTSDVKRINNMPIRTVAENAAPSRIHVRGGISSKQDYMDVLAELNKNQKGVAIIVDMDKAAWVNENGEPMKNPEVVFAGSLRRRFELGGLSLTAYQSGSLQITVRRLTALEVKEREASAKRRKKA